MARKSNAQAARELGIHHTSMSRIRANKRLPSLRLLATMVEQWGLDPDRVLEAVRTNTLGTYLESEVLEEESTG